ncbi:MAG: hypothetical protein IKP10_05685 [Clostridia bacterium]|nr:hypothetical protein [Clostridia bacterium]
MERNETRDQAPEPGCGTCIRRDVCPRAQDGKFCPQWQSREPQRRGEDPNARWRRGEECGF